MELTLYPENLVGLELNFPEAIYTIAFGLEAEIGRRGKAVFMELGMTAEEMAKQVDYCLDKVMHHTYSYALRRVLGDLGPSEDGSYFDGSCYTLSSVFELAVKDLQIAARGRTNYRNLLIKGKTRGVQYSSGAELLEGGDDVSRLCFKVQQLLNEVEAYDRKREQAQAKIMALLAEIQKRGDCPLYFGKEESTSVAWVVDLSTPLSQIFWSYRSAEVLHKLGLTTAEEAVEYFQDFQNFVDGNDITLLEWLVITAVLRKHGLLSPSSDCFKLQDRIKDLGLSSRAYNSLKYRGFDTIGDVVMQFSDGAAEGWGYFWRMRQFGKKSYEEFVQRLSEVTILIDEELCFPTPESSVRALDFGRDDWERLQLYEIRTIGDLLEACADENRFTGLRYVDKSLYQIAKAHLDKYIYS